VFSAPVEIRSKAQCDGNGYSLAEQWNAVAEYHRDALRVNKLTELATIRWGEY
jgi:hypothetical protein